MGRVIKIVLIALVVCGLAYAVITIVANVMGAGDTKTKLPDVTKAQYVFTVQNSGRQLLTNNYEQFGTTVGSRMFLLHGYFELSGREFKYRDKDLPLDEKVWGKIDLTVRRIQKDG